MQGGIHKDLEKSTPNLYKTSPLHLFIGRSLSNAPPYLSENRTESSKKKQFR
ncbi:hypothetical protein NEILACOT_05660 [Neisseria lactamica ATCC 23970]|uniref:Uncharacterized protein n=1 Tax=Neisseria lactamica ATCC 23970 TaxID=546265 RepID=D0WDM2_NEILA|nr:hypothetical protein NEILACOT_05660 [Neisseria lactamica ATCC 23970]